MPSDVVALAVATAVSPLPFLALLVVLLTRRAAPNGWAFVLGWSAALLVVGAVTVLVVGESAGFDEHSAGVAAFEVLVGVALLALALRQWLRRPRVGAEVVEPRWLLFADRSTPPRAFALGGLLVLANPKNLALTVAAGGAVAGASDSSRDRALALVLFSVVGTAGLAVPLTLRITLGQRSERTLTRWRRWLVVHGSAVTCTVLVLVAVLLVGRGATA